MRRREGNDRKKAYIGLFIIAVMILSTVGFIASFNQNQQQDYSYNGFEFKQQGNLWVTEAETPFGEKEFGFLFHPLSLEVDVPEAVPAAIKQAPNIVLAFNPNVSEIQYVDAARFELSQYLVPELGKNVKHMVTQNTTQYNFPVETCSPVPNTVYITFEEAEQRSATINDNCITLTALSPIDHVQYAETIIYMLLGVIQ